MADDAEDPPVRPFVLRYAGVLKERGGRKPRSAPDAATAARRAKFRAFLESDTSAPAVTPAGPPAKLDPGIARKLAQLAEIGAEVRQEMVVYDQLPEDPTMTRREAALRRTCAKGEAFRRRGVFVSFSFRSLDEIEEPKQ